MWQRRLMSQLQLNVAPLPLNVETAVEYRNIDYR
jgi:hypothetical protein